MTRTACVLARAAFVLLSLAADLQPAAAAAALPETLAEGIAALPQATVVPLAEAWDSGASQWSAKHREAYANGLDAERSLIAGTAKSNRSKADQDPAQWMLQAADAHCTYAAHWVSTQLRWNLTANQAEIETLNEIAANCPTTPIEAKPANV
jgi:hypothetical protein